MITSMAALLAPASTADLASAMAHRRRLFVRSDDPRRFRGLLPWATLDTLFRVNRFAPDQVRVLRASADVRPSMYRDPADPSQLRLDALQGLAAQGVSVVVNAIDTLVPPIAALSAMAARHFRWATSVNAYVTFRRSSAFRPHWDDHDVLVLQVQGRKRWRSFGIARDRPIEGHTFARREDAGPVAWEEVLEPGDVLYLPRGEVHEADVEDGSTSVHLTMGLRPPRGSDVLRWLARGTDDALRADVSPAWSDEELACREAALKAAFHELVDGIDLKAFLAERDRRLELRPAPSFGAIAGIEPGTWLASALPRRVEVPEAQGGSVRLTIGTGTYEMSPAAAALLALLQERNVMTVDAAHAALGAYDLETLRRAASELAQKGLLIEMGPEIS